MHNIKVQEMITNRKILRGFIVSLGMDYQLSIPGVFLLVIKIKLLLN